MIISLLITIAFFTLAERKFMGAIQRRKGPDVVGFLGLLQAIADGVKLVLKEIILPYKISMVLFLIGPSLVFFLSLCGWVVLPFSDLSFASVINVSVLFVFVTSGFNIYGLVLSGWSSNSRYAFLGGIRATAQMISYELVLGMINLFIFFLAGSFNLTEIVKAQTAIWFIVPLFPVFIIYLIVMLAETNRTPFDLAEAEAELVAGYNVEYSSITFALFFLGEYANMIFLSFLGTLYFLGGWHIPFISFNIFGLSEIFFIFKVLLFCMFFIWIRATLPRYRYDQLMELAWKVLLPILFSFFLFIISISCFWKQWLFYLSVILVFVMNFIIFIVKLCSKIHFFNEYLTYNLIGNVQGSSVLVKLETLPEVRYHLVNPILEIFNIFNDNYNNNTKYSFFFRTSKKFLSYSQMIYARYYEDIVSTYNTKRLYRFDNLIKNIILTYTNILEINNEYDLLLKETKKLSPFLDIRGHKSLFQNRLRMIQDFPLLDIKSANAAAKIHFKTQDLSTVDEYELLWFWENIYKEDLDKLMSLYKAMEEKLVLLKQAKYDLIFNLFLRYTKPFYAPFLFLSHVWQITQHQVVQVFPIIFSKLPLFEPTSILYNQSIINAKYI